MCFCQLQGLVAFSEHGLMIRWWSLGSVWWEKLSRNFVPVQCTKLIFIPPWEGFSPNSSRSSIMGSIMGNDRQVNSQVILSGCNLWLRILEEIVLRSHYLLLHILLQVYEHW